MSIEKQQGAENTKWIRAASGLNPQISSATNAARISHSNATYLVSCWPPWSMEEGGMACFFCQGPRTGASAENVSPTNHRPSNRSNIDRYLLQEKKMSHFFFWTSRFQVLQGMFVQNFAKKFEELNA